MKHTKLATLVSSALLSSALLTPASFAEVQLPHTPSEDLTAAQISENLQALNTAVNASQTELETLSETLSSVTTTKILQRMGANGETVTLLTQGDLSVKASCSFLNSNDSSSGRGLAIWTESSELASLVANQQSTGYYGHTGDTAVGWTQVNTTSDSATKWESTVDQGVTVSAAGDVIIMDGESFGYGINVQGTDCLIVGNILSFTGDAAPEDFDPNTSIPR